MAVKIEPANERYPCKFCGADPVLHKRKIKGMSVEAFMVSCSNQRCQVYPATGWSGSAETATQEWNKQHGDKAMHAANRYGSWRK